MPRPVEILDEDEDESSEFLEDGLDALLEEFDVTNRRYLLDIDEELER